MMTETATPQPCCSPEDFPGADLFRALGDPNRLTILAQVASCCGNSKTVGEVAQTVPKDISVVSRHLATLRDAGVLRSERRGKEVHYFCCYEELVTALRSLADAIETCCPVDICSSDTSACTQTQPAIQDKGGPS